MSEHRIPEEMAQRTARLINEAEDMRAQAVDDLKTVYGDLREELKSLGWRGAEVSEQVAAFKAAIAETRLDDEKKAKREAKDDLVAEYINVLSSRARARARAKQSDREHDVPVVHEPVASLSGEMATTDAPEALVSDEPSPEAGPQAEASPAGTGAGMPADREGRHEGEAASVDLPTNQPEPVEALSEVALPTTDDDTDLSGSGRASGTGSAGGTGSTPVQAPNQPETATRPGRDVKSPSQRALAGGNLDVAADAAKAETMAGAASGSPAAPLNPLCQKPETCPFAHKGYSCSECNRLNDLRKVGKAAA